VIRDHRVLTLSLAGLIGLGALTACGSDAKKSDTTSAASTAGSEAGSYEIVADSVVTKGLADTIAAMTKLATAGGATADEYESQVHHLWESYEGTVKQNEPNDYLALEEALGAFGSAGEKKDAAGMTAAVTKFSTTSAGYLTKHPG
jgi:iron uptake system EfeUOB component EfeO/EfeM